MDNIKNAANRIAIVGMSGLFPSASSCDQLWKLLVDGKSTVGEIPPSRWPVDGFYSANGNGKNTSTSKWVCAIDGALNHDRNFSGLSTREASITDPQQRLLVEQTQLCLEDAGLSTEQLRKFRVSVYIGCMDAEYQLRVAEHLLEGEASPTITLGNYQAMLANRISLRFGFTGESKSINTACSSSAHVISDAYKALLVNDADFVIAGGANLSLSTFKYLSFSKAGMLSRTGKCTPFDISADGYVPGDCVAVLMLCKLEHAIENKLRIRAVIDGIATNHNGKRALSPTAPSPIAQIELLERALQSAERNASEVTYIEAHGTGTALGDPIEVEALSRVYGDNFCRIGSVKGVIGHTEGAAGLAGIIKVVLMMKYKKVTPNSWIKCLNPLIVERKRQLVFPTKITEWLSQDGDELVAGVSSFGFGGTNAHIILSSWHNTGIKSSSEKKVNRDCIRQPIPLLLSACSIASLNAYENKIFELIEQSSTDTAVMALKLACALDHHQHRKAIILKKPDNKIAEFTAIERKSTPLIHWKFTQSDASKESSLMARLIKSPVVMTAEFASNEVLEPQMGKCLRQLPLGSVVLDRLTGKALSVQLLDLVDLLTKLKSTLVMIELDVTSRVNQLTEYQFTFKMFMECWIKKIKLMENSYAFDEKILTSLAYVMSLSKLYMKWELQSTVFGIEPLLLQELMNTGLINEEDLIIAMLENDYQTLSTTIDRRFLTKVLDDEINVQQFVDNLQNIHINNCKASQFGFTAFTSDHCSSVDYRKFSLASMEENLVQVWLCGGEVNWPLYFEVIHNQCVENAVTFCLPHYEFIREEYHV